MWLFTVSLLLPGVTAIHKEVFTTNAVCREKNCVNPAFPGVESLLQMSEDSFFCEHYDVAASAMSFCRAAVNYDVALPKPGQGSTKEIPQIVKEQEQLAMTQYAFHLNGMGIEFWDATQPWDGGDDCTQAVWRMLCYTYFPKCDGSSGGPGSDTPHLKPCQSSCQNYVEACGVQCCDESVQCVFEREMPLAGGGSVLLEGYAPHDGPSALCTGASASTPLALVAALFAATGSQRTAVGAILLGAAMQLQGCGPGAQEHMVGNWRSKPDYLVEFQYIPPGGRPQDAILNSCSLDRLAQTLQCSGKGVCSPWDPSNLNNPNMFCMCDRDWADPECRTARKSQVTAYVLSVFGGFLGADLFYMGFPVIASLKLCTFGGFGVWWLVDIIRVGSAPVYAHKFRLSNDLPHYAFVLSLVMLAMAIGFTAVYMTTVRHFERRRKNHLMSTHDYGSTTV